MLFSDAQSNKMDGSQEDCWQTCCIFCFLIKECYNCCFECDSFDCLRFTCVLWMFIVPMIIVILSIFTDIPIIWFFISFGIGAFFLIGVAWYLRKHSPQIYEYMDYCDVCHINFPVISGFVYIECSKSHIMCLDCWDENSIMIDKFIKLIQRKSPNPTSNSIKNTNNIISDANSVGIKLNEYTQVFEIEKDAVDILNDQNLESSEEENENDKEEEEENKKEEENKEEDKEEEEEEEEDKTKLLVVSDNENKINKSLKKEKNNQNISINTPNTKKKSIFAQIRQKWKELKTKRAKKLMRKKIKRKLKDPTTKNKFSSNRIIHLSGQCCPICNNIIAIQGHELE